MSDAVHTTSPSRRNPVLILLVAVVALAAIGFAAFAFLGSDDGLAAADEPPVAAAATASTDASDVTEQDVETVSLETLPTVTYDVFLSRDPFDPVIPEPAPATTETVSTQPSTEPQPYEDVQPVAGDDQNDDQNGGTDTGGTDDVDDACRGGTEEVVCDGRVVTLLELTGGAEPVAVIQVDTQTYEVRPGDRFAERFLFLDVVDAGTVRLLFGDQAFRISVGERVMK
jgi:hypothetical protein